MTNTVLPADAAWPADPPDEERARLIERVNRLYHEWTAERFDADHRARHRVEAKFWQWVGRSVLRGMNAADSAGHDHRAAARSTRQPPNAEGKLILDVACGSGFVIDQLAPWMSASDRAVGVDLSIASLASASRKLEGNCGDHLHWMACTGTQLPLAGASVDLVTLNASLHHFASPEAVLRELDRVLRPGGHLAIGFEPNKRYFQSAMLRGTGAALDRLSWYLSPRQNIRRLRTRLAAIAVGPGAAGDIPDATLDDREIAARIALRLIDERRVAAAPPPETVLDLVDPHARCGRDRPGLNWDALFATCLKQYQVVELFTSDYLGASLRRRPALRAAIDGLGRRIAPDCGSLLSCLLRKEGTPA